MSEAAPASVPLRRLVLPAEHGGWAFLGEPILLGLAVTPSPASLLLALAVIAAFLARQPWRLLTGDRSRGRRYPRTAAAERAFAVLIVAAALGLAGALVLSSGPLLLAVGAAAPLAALALALEAAGHPRAWLTELAAPLALAATPSAMALAAGWPVPAAFGLWAILAVRVVPTIPYIRARVRLDKGERPSLVLPLALALAAIAAAAWLASEGLAPRLGVAAAVVLALRAAWGLSPLRPRTSVKVLGFTEVFFGLLTVALVAAGVRLGR